MPFGKGDEFFLFHQRDNRNPEPFGEPFGWDLATTKDFVDYRDCGVAVPRGGDDEQDQFVFATDGMQSPGRRLCLQEERRESPARPADRQLLL